MATVRVLRVFTDVAGESGNQLGVVCDTGEIDRAGRQAIAAELGYSETVFVEDETRLQIFTPTTELPFAGHPLVGAAWLLGQPVLHPPAGAVRTGVLGNRAWILARAEWSPVFERRQLGTPAEVDAFRPPRAGNLHVWAWQDETRGRIRARVFAPDLGVLEDPATGSASIALCAALGGHLTIEQGPGCLIEVRPLENGLVELGGRVADEGDREI
ncbi:MAG TPA: PhzF family phenazine biosynthesis protein [Solirubrobacteraceae bacterium]|jgi:predicted PhzF superfamily epimerase YddE/YHI9|nr:PhzF family phenazine biosynthesis protein [Solirubrobacteraceae bacterium]